MTGLRWQYLRVLMEQLPPIERLDELGSQGWEAIQYGPLPGHVTLYEWLFKRAVFEHPALVEMAREGVEEAQKRGTDGWPTLDALEQETKEEGAIDRAFREFKEQNPGVSAALGPAPQPQEAALGQSEAVKRARSPEHMAKMRAARWGHKSSPAPEEVASRG